MSEQTKALKAQLELEVFGVVTSPSEDELARPEVWWRERFGWLKDRGYLLRRRYSPDWKPSWVGTKRSIFASEDGHPAQVRSLHPRVVEALFTKRQFPSRLLDATRLSDGKYVVLKLVKKSHRSFEVEIGQYFSSEALAGASGNHCIPIYDILHVPDNSETTIIVMPLLLEYMHPPFDTIGEAVECFRQLIEVSSTQLQSLEY